MPNGALAALQKATSIGPPKPGRETALPTPAEEADPIRRFMDLISDPFGIAQPTNVSAGIGGLPEGLNAHAIMEMLKREGLHVATDPHAVIDAAKQAGPTIARSLLPLLKR